ncbi:MAG: transposase [Lentisphaerae bacterium]|nr:transposase [Lentisphaerota bacterium]
MIGELYKSSWTIEVFFKEIKQTLQLADFMGTSKNAVKWQIWTVLLTYLLLRFIAWKHSFHRLFTLIRAILWNFLNLEAVLKACEKGKSQSNKLPPPAPKQMEFYF